MVGVCQIPFKSSSTFPTGTTSKDPTDNWRCGSRLRWSRLWKTWRWAVAWHRLVATTDDGRTWVAWRIHGTDDYRRPIGRRAKTSSRWAVTRATHLTAATRRNHDGAAHASLTATSKTLSACDGSKKQDCCQRKQILHLFSFRHWGGLLGMVIHCPSGPRR